MEKFNVTKYNMLVAEQHTRGDKRIYSADNPVCRLMVSQAVEYALRNVPIYGVQRIIHNICSDLIASVQERDKSITISFQTVRSGNTRLFFYQGSTALVNEIMPPEFHLPQGLDPWKMELTPKSHDKRDFAVTHGSLYLI